MLDPVPIIAIRLSLALLLTVSAIQKLRAPAVFAAAVRDYEVLPPALAAPVAALLITSELALAASAIAGFSAAVLAIALLLLLYSAAIGINLWRGRTDIDCGCGGPRATRPLSGWLIVRNACLITLACIALVPANARPLGPVDLFSISAALIAAAALYAAGETLAATAPRLEVLRHG